MKRFRLWQLSRAYKLVGKLEQVLGYPQEAMEMRASFFRETWRFVEQRSGDTRAQRRKARRDLVGGK